MMPPQLGSGEGLTLSEGLTAADGNQAEHGQDPGDAFEIEIGFRSFVNTSFRWVSWSARPPRNAYRVRPQSGAKLTPLFVIWRTLVPSLSMAKRFGPEPENLVKMINLPSGENEPSSTALGAG